MLAAAVAWMAALGLTAAACRRGVPVIDTSPPPVSVDGTISGTVSTTPATGLAGRRVEAIDLVTGRRFGVSTGESGGFSLKVPPGHYRLSVELRDGESLANPPPPIHINPSDLDHGVDLMVRVSVSRPRQPDVMRGPDALGAPVA